VTLRRSHPHAGGQRPRRASWRGAAVALPVCVLALAACSSQASARPVADAPLAAHRIELLDLAFRAASALPLDPHAKTRARLQESVVRACFELDQPRRALAHAERIEGWRRGIGYAEFALYCAQHGATSEVQHYLDLAAGVADGSAKLDGAQEWPRERIRAVIAQTHVVLGHDADADGFAAGLAAAESGRVHAAKATRLDASAVDAQLKELDAILAVGDFDRARGALDTCVELFDRFYDDAARRARLVAGIQTAGKKLPIGVRIDSLTQLTERALGHDDRAGALELVETARVAIESTSWLPEDRIEWAARLAALRFAAGDRERARRDADAALQLFDGQRERIVDIYRARALRPIAEAFCAMGDTGAAAAIYMRALEEGSVNPNARPRAEDLVATCCSMARRGIPRDASLWAKAARVHDGLGHPW
jgi:tetratricopeptide (TPR) repeat protein